jgi:hypothetical protein
MLITNEYTPDPEEFAKASFIFLEKKPILAIMIGVLNIFAVLLFFLIATKIAITISATVQESFALLFSAFWIFGRKPLNLWLFKRRMQASLSLKSPIKIEISLNGIAWNGQKLRPGSISWRDLKWVMQVKNGYIIPNHMTRFLWIPNHGFTSQHDSIEFNKLLIEKQIPLRVYDKWEC